MIRHPRFSTLRRFARGTAGKRDPRIAAHVMACPACRATVEAIADVISAARARPAAEKRVGGFDEVAERIRQGERLVLPSVTPPARSPSPLLRRAAVAAALLVAAILAVTGPPELAATRSELAVEPARPRMGETLTVRYRPTSLLAGQPRLVLRARLRAAGDGQRGGRTVTVATLTPGEGGSYEGSFTLPDSVVLAVLAVESEDGSSLDVNRERWELLAHGGDGQPLVTALLQRRMDAHARDSRIDAEVAEQLVAMYPERPESWDAAWIAEATRLGYDAVDSLNAYHREHHLPRLEAALAADPSPGPRALGSMVWYTRRLEDTMAMARWKAELYARHPRHGFALMWRTFDLDRAHRGDAPGLLRAYEELWARVGAGAEQLTVNGLALAGRLGDPELVRTWGERMERADSSTTPSVALAMARFPELRPHAIRRIRREIERTLDITASERPLRYTVPEFRLLRERRAGTLLSTLGTMLLAEGDTAAALDALRRAAEGGWDPGLARQLGEIHLALGDTASAARAFARAAVDPINPRAFADSARARMPELAAGAWQTSLAAAREEMIDRTWQEAIRRPPQRALLRLLDIEGRRVDVDLPGAVTVVALWSRYCPYSVQQLQALDRMAATQKGDGVRVLIVTDDDDPAAVAAYLERRGVAFSTLLDIERDAYNAFDSRSSVYLVLDAEGVVRFSGHAPEAVPRQVAALRADRP